MHRWFGVALVSMSCVLACSANTLGTAMDGSDQQDSLGDEPGSSEGGESGSAGVDESDAQDTSSTTTTSTSTSTSTTDEGCPLGSEGCPCTGGGGCDPGLECDAGTCVPSGTSSETTGDPTTDSTTTTGDPTTDSTTTDSTTTGGEPFMCMLGNDCGDYDLASCTCETCITDGMCTYGEDCVCPDCANNMTCASGCNDDGVCNPYDEGCDCSDCAQHPLCG